MNTATGPLPPGPAKKTQLPVGIPARVPDPATHEQVEARQVVPVNILFMPLFPAVQFPDQSRAECLIPIEAEDPFVTCLLQSVLLLSPVASPLHLEKTIGKAPADPLCVISTERVDNNDFVRQP